MPPKTTDNYTLLDPLQTVDLKAGGESISFPIFTNPLSRKIYLQCDKCRGFFLLNASRIPMNLGTHRGGEACNRAAQRLQQQEVRLEAISALSVFNRQISGEAAGSGMRLP